LLFEKIEDEVIEVQIKKLMDTKKEVELASQPVAPAKHEITFDDFSKLDIRIGKIVEAEKVEKSKKLLKLKVDTGIDVRTVMSGIAEHFTPETVLGKQVTILVNLAPRKIMGIESQGMILMAEDKDGKLRLLQPSEVVAQGSTIS
jgi:methionyl-tRNA synthetase